VLSKIVAMTLVCLFLWDSIAYDISSAEQSILYQSSHAYQLAIPPMNSDTLGLVSQDKGKITLALLASLKVLAKGSNAPDEGKIDLEALVSGANDHVIRNASYFLGLQLFAYEARSNSIMARFRDSYSENTRTYYAVLCLRIDPTEPILINVFSNTEFQNANTSQSVRENSGASPSSDEAAQLSETVYLRNSVAPAQPSSGKYDTVAVAQEEAGAVSNLTEIPRESWIEQLQIPDKNISPLIKGREREMVKDFISRTALILVSNEEEFVKAKEALVNFKVKRVPVGIIVTLVIISLFVFLSPIYFPALLSFVTSVIGGIIMFFLYYQLIVPAFYFTPTNTFYFTPSAHVRERYIVHETTHHLVHNMGLKDNSIPGPVTYLLGVPDLFETGLYAKYFYYGYELVINMVEGRKIDGTDIRMEFLDRHSAALDGTWPYHRLENKKYESALCGITKALLVLEKDEDKTIAHEFVLDLAHGKNVKEALMSALRKISLQELEEKTVPQIADPASVVVPQQVLYGISNMSKDVAPFDTDTDVDRQIRNMCTAARETGLAIPTNIHDGRYTLLVNYDLHKDNKELKADIRGYNLPNNQHIGSGDRFDIERINTANVNNILAHVKNPATTIVQVSHEFSDTDIAKLKDKAPCIRVLRVETKDFKELDNATRRSLRFDLYAMMLAARRVTEDDIRENTAIYRILKFFLNTHYKDGKEDIAPSLIEALVRNELAILIKHSLSYRPAEIWRRPSYHTVAATLISA